MRTTYNNKNIIKQSPKKYFEYVISMNIIKYEEMCSNVGTPEKVILVTPG